MTQRTRMVTGFALVAILLVALTSPVWAQGPVTRISSAIIGSLTINGSATAGNDLIATDDLIALDDISASDDIVANGSVTLGEGFFTARGTQTLTMNGTITNTYALLQLSAAGTVNTSSIAAGVAGQRLTIVNGVNQSIVLTDTGTLRLSGNLTLGQYDTVELVSDGTNWIQLATTNN